MPESSNPTLVEARYLRPGMVLTTLGGVYRLVTCATPVGDDEGTVYVTLTTLSAPRDESSLFFTPDSMFRVVDEVKHPHENTPEWEALLEKYSSSPTLKSIWGGTSLEDHTQKGAQKPSEALRDRLMENLADLMKMTPGELETALDGTLKPTVAAELAQKVGPSAKYWVGLNMQWRASQTPKEGAEKSDEAADPEWDPRFDDLPGAWRVAVDEAVRRGDFHRHPFRYDPRQPNLGCMAGIGDCFCNSSYTQYESRGGPEYFQYALKRHDHQNNQPNPSNSTPREDLS